MSNLRNPALEPFDEVPLCLICEERPAVVRGQCRRCRQGTSRCVAARMITEQELIDFGVLLPPQQGPQTDTPVKWRKKLEAMELIPRRRSFRPNVVSRRRPRS